MDYVPGRSWLYLGRLGLRLEVRAMVRIKIRTGVRVSVSTPASASNDTVAEVYTLLSAV